MKNSANIKQTVIVGCRCGVHCFFLLCLFKRAHSFPFQQCVLVSFLNDNYAGCMNLLNFNFHLNGLIVVNELNNKKKREIAILLRGSCLSDVTAIVVVFDVDVWLTQRDERRLICTDMYTLHTVDDRKKNVIRKTVQERSC